MSNLQEIQLDLSQLAVDRGPQAASVVSAPKRNWLTRYFVPGGILVAFASLFAWATKDSFLPATTVTITPVVVSRVEIRQEGTPLFQAAGWVEPRPTAVIASSLAPGVIEELLVVEGQAVEKGEPVAKLIDVDAKLALSDAKATLQLREAEQKRAEASLEAALAALSAPTELLAQHAEAEANLAATQLSLGSLPHQIEAARSRASFATESLRRKEQVGEAVAGKIVREARAEMAAANSALNELESREPTLRAELDALNRRRDALHQRLKLMTTEKRGVQIGEAEVAAARAVTQQARLAVEIAQLTLDRMTVRSPISGRVLSLDARPGQRLNGSNILSEQGSSSVVSLYDPQSLQIRVDVRLEDVPRVQVGQAVTIETAALAEPIAGKTLSITTRADIQKNTLQVKVGIDGPPDVIKPEMLAKVTFLAPPSVGDVAQGQPPLRIYVPQSLINSGAVWVADLSTNVARLKSVEVGRTSPHGELVEIKSGLNPTDKLIVTGRELLVDSKRIRIAGEDTTVQLVPSLSGTTASNQQTNIQ